LALTEYQIKSIRDADKKAKEDYLTAEPKGIDSAAKTHPTIKNIMESWGK
jgi:hypothetical protein